MSQPGQVYCVQSVIPNCSYLILIGGNSFSFCLLQVNNGADPCTLLVSQCHEDTHSSFHVHVYLLC